jgi:hypothetical protein
MLCRNRVSDFSKWKSVFDSHAEAHRDAGLRLVNLWRSIEEPANIFFVLEVEDLDRAREFINSPDSARAGEESGVVDGEYHFVESAPGY